MTRISWQSFRSASFRIIPVLLLSAVVLYAVPNSGNGIGIKGGFAYTNSPYFEGPVPYVAFTGMFEWDFEQAGQMQYCPNVGYWFGGQIDSVHHQISVTPIEFNYQLPATEQSPFQAHIGAGIGGGVNIISAENKTKPGVLANVHGAVSLKALKVFVPYGELRLSIGNYNSMTINVGLLIRKWNRKDLTIRD